MTLPFTDRTWLWLAAALYLAGFIQGSIALFKRGRPAGGATYALILLGYLAQLAGLGLRGRAVGGCPLGNAFELYQFTAWSAITLYLVVGATFRLSLLGYFTACLASTVTLVSLLFPSWDAGQRVRIFGHNPWIELHAALAVFSYGVFALLALTSLMFLLRHFSLKSKRLGGWFSFLPSIRDLDHMGVRLLAAGAAILGFAVAVGAVHWAKPEAVVNLEKVVVTVAVAGAAFVLLLLRLRGVLLARRFAVACLILYAAALLSLVTVGPGRGRVPAPPTPAAR